MNFFERLSVSAGWITLAFSLLALFAINHDQAGAEPEAIEFMRPEELERGMEGRGRSVFTGTKIEQFKVEIISVLRDVEPGRDIILARVEAPQLRDGGVASGMSGSPVYINGRLIGAIAYTWGFTRESVCGITPIHEMLHDVIDNVEDDRDVPMSFAYALDDSIPVPNWGRAVSELLSGRGAIYPRNLSVSSDNAGLRRLETPVMVSGASARLIERMKPIMSQYGLAPVQSGTAGRLSVKPPELRPGSAVGIRLIGGDLNLTAIGTVTHRDGEEVYAFGHPFLDAGRLDAPMTGAYVHDIMPSLQLTFKLADGMDTIGAFRYDRGSVVHGRYGAAADTMPFDIVINRRDIGATGRYSYDIMRHEMFSPILVGMAAGISAERTEPQMQDTMADITMTMNIRGLDKPLIIRDMVYDQDIAWQLFAWGMTMGIVTGNPFTELEVDSVRLEIDLARGRNTAEIHSMRVDSHFVKLGEKVGVTALLRPYRSRELVEKRVELEIPADIQPGTELQVTVCDAWAAENLKRMNSPGEFIIESFDQMLSVIDQLERSDNLVVFMSLPRTGVSRMGRSMPDLPGSIMRVMRVSIESGAFPVQDALVQRVPTDWVISGRQSMPILVIEE